MKLLLRGHDYRYAVEQILLTLFPEERPVYVREPEGGRCIAVSLHRGEVFTVATTVMRLDGRDFTGSARCENSQLTGKLRRDSLCQKLIKLSFFEAGRAATGFYPPWGALTGIRPAKLAAQFLERGMDEGEAAAALCREYLVTPERARIGAECGAVELETRRALPERSFSLYVGIPFCPTRCAYCSFVSQSVEKSLKLVRPYLDALRLEIEAAGRAVRREGLTLSAVYIGGGTPTTLSAEELSTLLNALAGSFDLSNASEFTVEAGRPDTIDPGKLSALRRGGVSRVSINPQSMDAEVLAAIGRRHSPEDVLRAFREAREAGFREINMDIIAGLPRDSDRSFAKTLDTVLALAPENVTVHTLALKRGSRITLEREPIPDGAAVGRFVGRSIEELRARGFAPYYTYRQKFTAGGFENTGWTLPGHGCAYNVIMMEELHTVLSLGGGGVTKLVDGDKKRISRIFNPKYPYEYISGIGKTVDRLSRPDFFRQSAGEPV